MTLRPEAVTVFLDAYSACAGAGDTELFNLRQSDEATGLHFGRRADLFRARLRDGSFWTRPRVVGAQGDAGLREAMALVAALSSHIAAGYGPSLDRGPEPFADSQGRRYWLKLREPSPIGARFSKGIRFGDELHFTLAGLCHGLVVTPVSHPLGTLFRVPRYGLLEAQIERRLKAGTFHLAVSPLSYEAQITGDPRTAEPPPAQSAFHLEDVGPLDEQLEALEEVLRKAYASGAAVLVLPELRMTPPLLAAARRFLRLQTPGNDRGLLLVAAGSWHVPERGLWMNRCHILDFRGETLWTHDKLLEYTASPKNVTRSPETRAAFAQIGVGPGGGRENIFRGETLQFHDSAAGRFAAAICMGFFSPAIRDFLRASGADIFLVPAMTDPSTDLDLCSRELVRTQHAFTLFANCGRFGGKEPSFIRWPGRDKPNRPNKRTLEHPDTLLTVDLTIV